MIKKVGFDKEKAKKLYLGGKSASEIGKELNVNFQTIIAYLKKEGIYKPANIKKPSSKGRQTSKKKTNTVKTNGLTKVPTDTGKNKKPNTDKSKKSNTKAKKEEPVKFSKEEKIAYCNKKYGKGNWHFMSKDEFVAFVLYESDCVGRW